MAEYVRTVSDGAAELHASATRARDVATRVKRRVDSGQIRAVRPPVKEPGSKPPPAT